METERIRDEVTESPEVKARARMELIRSEVRAGSDSIRKPAMDWMSFWGDALGVQVRMAESLMDQSREFGRVINHSSRHQMNETLRFAQECVRYTLGMIGLFWAPERRPERRDPSL